MLCLKCLVNVKRFSAAAIIINHNFGHRNLLQEPSICVVSIALPSDNVTTQRIVLQYLSVAGKVGPISELYGVWLQQNVQ